MTPFSLPFLPYSYDALTPYIDERTMRLHHTKHHQGYVNKLNQALEHVESNTCDLLHILSHLNEHNLAVRNNAGGHYNHTLFWNVLTPKATPLQPGALSHAMAKQFGNLETFQSIFSQKATSCFGSGWAWLIVNKERMLEITTTPNQDNPLMPHTPIQGTPILGLDLWEHAYYLQYQNRRVDYIANFWPIVNWQVVEDYYSKALLAT